MKELYTYAMGILKALRDTESVTPEKFKACAEALRAKFEELGRGRE